MAAEPCALCRTAPTPSNVSSWKNQSVVVPLLGQTTCGALQEAMPTLLDAETPECSMLQSAIGTYCGCPLPEDACPGFLSLDNLEGEEEESDGSEFSHDKYVPDFLQFHGYNASCDVVQGYLQGSFQKETRECEQQTSQYAAACGYDKNVTVSERDNSSNNANVTKENVSGKQQQKHDYITVCVDGSPLPFPDRDFYEEFTDSTDNVRALNITALAVNGILTCQMIEDAAKLGLIPQETFFSEEHYFASGVCGCPPPVENSCNFCPTNDITQPDKWFPLMRAFFDLELKCSLIAQLLGQHEETDLRCWTAKNFAFVCGCNDGTPWYLGASTEQQHTILAWIPRITGFLSFMGSVYIIQNILRQRRKATFQGRHSTYHMILLGMSFFDISSSLAWMVSTLALPEYDKQRESESGVYGAKGNMASCRAQGFFLELGFIGSTTFTASLTIYYVLNIIYGYREGKMRPLQKYFTAIPIILAVTLASAAIPYYRPFYVGCFVSNPNSEVDRYADQWRYLVIFTILPVGISILISVCCLGCILAYVCKQKQAMAKYRLSLRAQQGRFSSHSFQTPEDAHFSTNESKDFSTASSQRFSSVTNTFAVRWSKTEAAVFWQAFWYVISFLLTWVIYLIGQFKPYFSSDDDSLYTFWIMLLVLNPLMGFWNAFIFVKPWTWSYGRVIPSFWNMLKDLKHALHPSSLSEETSSSERKTSVSKAPIAAPATPERAARDTPEQGDSADIGVLSPVRIEPADESTWIQFDFAVDSVFGHHHDLLHIIHDVDDVDDLALDSRGPFVRSQNDDVGGKERVSAPGTKDSAVDESKMVDSQEGLESGNAMHPCE